MPFVAQKSNVVEHAQLPLAGREASLVVGNEPEGHLACAKTARAFGLQRGSRTGAYEGALVRSGGVDHGLHELVSGTDAVARSVRRYDARALPADGTFDHDGDVNVARQAVSTGDEEEPRAVLAKIAKRVEKPWTVLKIDAAANALVRVPRGHGDLLALGPLLDSRTLSLGSKALVLGADANVGDGDLGAATASDAHH